MTDSLSNYHLMRDNIVIQNKLAFYWCAASSKHSQIKIKIKKHIQHGIFWQVI